MASVTPGAAPRLTSSAILRIVPAEGGAPLFHPGAIVRISIPLEDLWSGYAGQTLDGLCIEVDETWLEAA